MALLVRLSSPDDLSEIVEALITAADTKDTEAPVLAARWREIAHDIGDSLDLLPKPHK
jgi:hypothetical protein